MNKVATLSNAQRAELFKETAALRGIAPAIVEKDFWVTWVLAQLFTIPSLKGHIVFKGGTSLSKVFNAIQRFSEDIDLIIDYEMLGFHGVRHPSKQASRSKRIALLREMLLACSVYIEERLLEELRTRFTAVLGPDGWTLISRRSSDDGAVIEFAYPRSVAQQLEYVKPVVLLEPGTHAEFVPKGTFSIRSFAAEAFPHLFVEPEFGLEAITAERTFWEKATILHAEYHRPADKRLSTRHSRHYYDLAMLARMPIRARALADVHLRERVVLHKTEFYYSKWARYDLAVPGTFRLVPTPDRMAELRRDYLAMSDMLFGTPPPFEDVIEELRLLEADVNRG